MKRRTFLGSIAGSAAGSMLLPLTAPARIASHNWNACDYGTGPTARDRLYQGPFPQYPPEAFVPDSDVVMTDIGFERNRAELRNGSHRLRVGRLLAHADRNRLCGEISR